MERDYWWLSNQPEMDYMREFLEQTLGDRGKLLRFESKEHPQRPGLFDHECTVDWFGVDDWLDDKVRRILGSLKGTESWSVFRINGFVDFSFAPLVSPEVEELAAQHPKLIYQLCVKELYEHCEIRGATRYGAIGEYWDTYRFCAAPIDERSDERGIFDVEDSLEVCVTRIAEYIQTGQGENDVNLTRRYFRKPR